MTFTIDLNLDMVMIPPSQTPRVKVISFESYCPYTKTNRQIHTHTHAAD